MSLSRFIEPYGVTVHPCAILHLEGTAASMLRHCWVVLEHRKALFHAGQSCVDKQNHTMVLYVVDCHVSKAAGKESFWFPALASP